MAIILSKHFDGEQASQLLSIDELKQKIAFFDSIIRHEYLNKEEPRPFEELLNERLNLLQIFNEIERTQSQVKLVRINVNKKAEKHFTFISYFTEMGMYMIDTYLLVLIAVSEINNANYVIKQENLIQQLHLEI